MIDRIFGALNYDGGWTKYDRLNFWGKEIDVKITVSSYENEKPTEAQQESYQILKKDLCWISSTTLKKLKEYINEIKEDICEYEKLSAIPDDIFKLVSISQILFMENGSFGIMCNAIWDTHGVAVLCKDGGTDFEVGPQDIVWLEG